MSDISDDNLIRRLQWAPCQADANNSCTVHQRARGWPVQNGTCFVMRDRLMAAREGMSLIERHKDIVDTPPQSANDQPNLGGDEHHPIRAYDSRTGRQSCLCGEPWPHKDWRILDELADGKEDATVAAEETSGETNDWQIPDGLAESLLERDPCADARYQGYLSGVEAGKEYAGHLLLDLIAELWAGHPKYGDEPPLWVRLAIDRASARLREVTE